MATATAVRVKAPKVKVTWRGQPEGVKHAVRTVDGVIQDRAVCGAALRETWTPDGVRLKKADRKCSKCEKLEPLGQGPGGANYRPKKDEVSAPTQEKVSA